MGISLNKMCRRLTEELYNTVDANSVSPAEENGVFLKDGGGFSVGKRLCDDRCNCNPLRFYS